MVATLNLDSKKAKKTAPTSKGTSKQASKTQQQATAAKKQQTTVNKEKNATENVSSMSPRSETSTSSLPKAASVAKRASNDLNNFIDDEDACSVSSKNSYSTTNSGKRKLPPSPMHKKSSTNAIKRRKKKSSRKSHTHSAKNDSYESSDEEEDETGDEYTFRDNNSISRKMRKTNADFIQVSNKTADLYTTETFDVKSELLKYNIKKCSVKMKRLDATQIENLAKQAVLVGSTLSSEAPKESADRCEDLFSDAKLG